MHYAALSSQGEKGRNCSNLHFRPLSENAVSATSAFSLNTRHYIPSGLLFFIALQDGKSSLLDFIIIYEKKHTYPLIGMLSIFLIIFTG